MAGVPFVFGNATTSIPLTNLDANFNTGLTIGNTTVGLGNTVTTLGNVTLTNATISSPSGIAANAVIYSTSTGNLTGNATIFSVNSTSVGIGTSSPGQKLDVSTSTDIQARIGNSATGAQFTYDIGRVAASGLLQFYGNQTTATGYIFSGIDGERMRIDSSGNLLVGQTAQSYATVGFSVLGSGSGSNNGTVNSCLSTSTNASSSYNLYSTGAAAFRFYVDMGGTVHATSIVITAISDERLKENVRDIDTGLSSVMALKPRRYDWKEGKGLDKKNAAGFIAQEFETVFPDSVGLSKAGGDGIEYKNINYEELIPTLTKAIQEQQALITTLQTQVTALQAKVGV